MCNAFVCAGHMAAYEFYGHMAELVDAPVSGTGGATHGSSSLLMPTTLRQCFGWQATFRQCFGWQACVFASGKAAIVEKKFWGCSSVDRALRSHRRGRGFESHQLHHEFSLSRIKCARLRKFSAARSLGEVWHKA